MEAIEKQKELKDEIKFITIGYSKCELHINNKSHKKPSLIFFNDFAMSKKNKTNKRYNVRIYKRSRTAKKHRNIQTT
ncbi:MAG: hypothetical protein HFE04_00040 [Bacilli bacterium]|nr:hypothetical protein [Bacilli bacterium]